MIIVADTSALYAAFDAAQAEHGAAAGILEREALVISPLVITELDRLIHRDLGFPQALLVMEALNDRMADGRYELAELRHADLMEAHEVRQKYSALRLDLADAIGVILAHRFRTDCIFTLDQRDFRAVAPLTAKFAAFRILPADL